jgi:hypothetical protein
MKENKIKPLSKVKGLEQQVSKLQESLKNLEQGSILEKQQAFMKKYEGILKSQNIVNSYYFKTSYLNTFSKVRQERSNIIQQIKEIKSYSITQVIINQIIEDAFTPDIKTNKILDLKCKNKEVQKEIDFLKDKMDFDSLTKDASTEMLYYGEYILSTRITPGKGLTDLVEDIDIINIIPLSKITGSEGYLVIDPRTGDLTIENDAKYIKFIMQSQRLKIDIQDDFAKQSRAYKQEDLDTLPRYIRMGTSVIYPVIDKIKDLDLLENLVPASKLKKLSNGTLVGVNLPAGYDIEQARDFCNTIEETINKKTAVNPQNGYISAQNVIEAAGEFKVVPLIGGTGELKKMDYAGQEPDDLLNSLTMIRSALLDSAGIPSELVFGSSTKDGEQKSNFLKRYARYLRKLKSVRTAATDGVKQIIMVHLANKNKDKFKHITKDDIEVNFINDLIEIDNLDRLEFLDTTISFIKNTHAFITELAQPGSITAKYVDAAKYVKFLHDNFSTVNLDIINLDGKNKPMDATGDTTGGELSIEDGEVEDLGDIEGEAPTTEPTTTPAETSYDNKVAEPTKPGEILPA